MIKINDDFLIAKNEQELERYVLWLRDLTISSKNKHDDLNWVGNSDQSLLKNKCQLLP